jgi:hypothetical protein
VKQPSAHLLQHPEHTKSTVEVQHSSGISQQATSCQLLAEHATAGAAR